MSDRLLLEDGASLLLLEDGASALLLEGAGAGTKGTGPTFFYADPEPTDDEGGPDLAYVTVEDL